MAMQERKDISEMQLMEIPFSGMHRKSKWRTSEFLKHRIDEKVLNESVENIPLSILEDYLDERVSTNTF